MKKITLLVVAFACFSFLCCAANAQQLDVAFGVSGMSAPSSSVSSGLFYPSLSGGAYPGFSGDFLFLHRLGVEGEVNWRASQFVYGGYENVRPVFWDINAIWAPRLAKNITAEVMAGIGGEDLRFYSGQYSCSYFYGCTTYVTSDHFMGDVGGGIRAYFWHGAFLRPEARLYLIHNNGEFSSSYAGRYGVSLGYSFGGR